MSDPEPFATIFLRPIMQVMAKRLGGAVILHAAPTGKILFVAGSIPGADVTDPIGARPHDYAERLEIFAQDGSVAKPDDLPVVRSMISGETITDEVWLLKGTNGPVPVFVDSYPLKDEDERVIGVMATATDPKHWSKRVEQVRRSMDLRNGFVRADTDANLRR